MAATDHNAAVTSDEMRVGKMRWVILKLNWILVQSAHLLCSAMPADAAAACVMLVGYITNGAKQLLVGYGLGWVGFGLVSHNSVRLSAAGR